MKSILNSIIVAAIFVCSLSSVIAELPAATDSSIKTADETFIGSRFSFDSGYSVSTTTFADADAAVVLGVNIYPFPNAIVGFYGDVRALDNDNTAIDQTHAGLQYRIAQGDRGSLGFYGGYVRYWEKSEHGIEAGLRGDARFFELPLNVYTKIGFEKPLIEIEENNDDGDFAAVAVVGISVPLDRLFGN